MSDLILPGIQRLKVPLPHEDLLLGYVNVYLLNLDDGYMLVDTGWGTAQAYSSLKEQLSRMGVSLEEIKLVLSTHLHPDHYGLSGKLKEAGGAKVALHRADSVFVRDRYIDMDSLLNSLGGWLHTNGVPEESLARIQTASLAAAEWVTPAVPDMLLEGGEVITAGAYRFRVVATPGHSRGHICLYEPEQKIMISGDHVLPTITSHIGLHPQSGENPLGDYLESLKMLEPFEVKLILPGHENPFTTLKERVRGLIRHHDERKAEIREKIKTEPRTAYDIATRIIWLSDTNGASFDQLSHWDKRLAILETLSHLECMRFDGTVNKLNRNGTVYYQSA